MSEQQWSPSEIGPDEHLDAILESDRLSELQLLSAALDHVNQNEPLRPQVVVLSSATATRYFGPFDNQQKANEWVESITTQDSSVVVQVEPILTVAMAEEEQRRKVQLAERLYPGSDEEPQD